MVKVIIDKRECHCNAFNYCVEEGCTRWAEIVEEIGEPEDIEVQPAYNTPCLTDPEHIY